MKKKEKVVVMGAGPAGLAAGYFLSQNGIKVKIFEKQSHVGGISKTIVKNGFRFDLGGHRWFTKNEQLNNLIKDLLSKELIEVKRTSRIFFDGKYFDYPIKIPNVIKGLGFWKSLKVIFSYFATRIKYRLFPRPLKTFEDWIVAHFGRVLFNYFFKTYTEKLWGIPTHQIGAEWAAQRIKGMSLIAAVKNAIIPSKNKPKTLIDKFLYPKLGIGRISERLAEEISKFSDIALQTTVREIEHKKGEIVSVVVDEKKSPPFQKREIFADSFISSIPITEFVQILNPQPPTQVLKAAQKLTWRNLITVHLMLNRSQVTSDTWVYIHEWRAGLGRLHEPKNWSKNMVPGQDKTSLVCEFWAKQGDKIWQKKDDELIEWAIKDVSEIMHFIKKEDVIDVFVVRTPKAYPIYKIGYKKPLEIVKNYLKKFKNLQLIGRYGTYKYNNMDHSILSGIWAAKNIIAGKKLYDLEQINVEEEYHEEHKN